MKVFGWKKAGALLLAIAGTLPATAAAQSNSAAPQQIPNIPFSLPPSTRPTPAPTPTSGPVVAPLPTPTPTPASAPTPRATVSASPSPSAIPTPSEYGADAVSGVVNVITKKEVKGVLVSPTSTASAPPAATPTPTGTPTSMPVSAAPAGQPASGTPAEGWIAIGVALAATAAAVWFLLRRPKRRVGHAAEQEPLELVEIVPPPPLAPAPAPEPPAPPTGLLTIPLRRRAAETGEPRVEISLHPKRAGTNLTSAAVDYRLVIRNTGGVAVRDVRIAMYMLSASAQQAQDLQMIFAAAIEQPMTPPFEIAAGGEVELSGMALLDRDRVNVMTIEGRPWFVPVLAVKADYRWGDNVGAPGVATAAYMIGIDRGEGAKMGPFRMDGPPQMHPRVRERKVG